MVGVLAILPQHERLRAGRDAARGQVVERHGDARPQTDDQIAHPAGRLPEGLRLFVIHGRRQTLPTGLKRRQRTDVFARRRQHRPDLFRYVGLTFASLAASASVIRGRRSSARW